MKAWLLALACQSAMAFSPQFCAERAPAVLFRGGGVQPTRGATYLHMAVAASGKKSKLLKSISKPKGTIAIMAEIKKKDPGTPDLEFPIPSMQVS